MRDYINIGSTPCDEDCAQVGSRDYARRAKKECEEFVRLIRKVCGTEPEGARLATKSFEHDFGTYYEVVCWFDDTIPDSIDYAFHVEANTPLTWKEEENSRAWRLV